MFEGVQQVGGRRLRVSVPCSTSNLGPGFDLIGLALSLYLRVELRSLPAGSGLRVVAEGQDWPPLEDDKLVRALRAVDGLGKADAARSRGGHDFELRVASEVPIGRGLGSSAAALVAGLLLGAASAAREFSRAELLAAALELEGHPDNVTPALLGGCVLSVPRTGGLPPRTVRQELHASLAHVVAWPATPLETAFARRLLPAQVAFADAVENPRRLALLLEGLRSGDPELLRLGGEDRLHVPHRLPHIPGGARALEAAHAAGAWLATISGSGSGLYAIASHDRAAEVAEAMRWELDAAAGPAEAKVVQVAAEPARVESVPEGERGRSLGRR